MRGSRGNRKRFPPAMLPVCANRGCRAHKSRPLAAPTERLSGHAHRSRSPVAEDPGRAARRHTQASPRASARLTPETHAFAFGIFSVPIDRQHINKFKEYDQASPFVRRAQRQQRTRLTGPGRKEETVGYSSAPQGISRRRRLVRAAVCHRLTLTGGR